MGKVRANVSIDAGLLTEARGLGLSVSALLEEGLRTRLAEERRRRWLAEHGPALQEANAFLASNGLWSDGRRLF